MTLTEAPVSTHAVDEIPPLARLAPLGLQHVLAMYAGAVAVPLIVGGALVSQGKLQSSDLPYLISADLLVAGIATLIQSIGFWRFGVRLPLMQGLHLRRGDADDRHRLAVRHHGDLRRGDLLRSVHDPAGPGVRQAAAVLPAAGDRHRDLDHRPVADAGRGRLGRRWGRG